MGWWNHLVRKSRAEKIASRQELWDKKEKKYISEPATFKCPEESHPMFTINVSVEKPVGVCYYCSRVWILKNGD